MAIDNEVLDQLLAVRDPQELFAKDGLLDELKKALSERMLAAELDDLLESEVAEGAIKRRNGSSRKTVLTETSKLTLAIPRDRAGTFDPKLIAKYQRRLPGFDDKIVSMYARGMTVCEIRGHLEELYGLDVPPDLISTLRMRCWRRWPSGKVGRSTPAIPLSSSMRSGSRSATRASCATRPCTSRSIYCPTGPRKSWASGSSSFPAQDGVP